MPRQRARPRRGGDRGPVRGLKAHSGKFAIAAGKPLPDETLAERPDDVRVGAANLRAAIATVRRHGVTPWWPSTASPPTTRPNAKSSSTSLPTGFTLPVGEVRASIGAGFVYPLCGDIPTMPCLSSHPAAERIDLDERGQIVGLS